MLLVCDRDTFRLIEITRWAEDTSYSQIDALKMRSTTNINFSLDKMIQYYVDVQMQSIFTAILLRKSEIYHLSHFDKIKQNHFL